MQTPLQLANLRPPMKRGESSRNPSGRNQYSADHELREQFQAICRAINEAPAAVSAELFAVLGERLTAHPELLSDRLLIVLLERIWPEKYADPQRLAQRRYRDRRRATRWASRRMW